MLIHIITIFPEFFESTLNCGILRIAQEKGSIEIKSLNLRDFSLDPHRTVDDYPFGGGKGMILKPEPIFKACESIRKNNSYTILLSPQGRKFDQKIASELADKEHLILICGRYKGVDERVRTIINDEISIGDYILSGGEIAALAIIDAVARLLPGVVGSEDSVASDSFVSGILDAPYYTRPQDFRGMKVPDILTSGDHEKIKEWRRRAALRQTKRLRPDLLKNVSLTPEEEKFLEDSGKENDREAIS